MDDNMSIYNVHAWRRELEEKRRLLGKLDEEGLSTLKYYIINSLLMLNEQDILKQPFIQEYVDYANEVYVEIDKRLLKKEKGFASINDFKIITEELDDRILYKNMIYSDQYFGYLGDDIDLQRVHKLNQVLEKLHDLLDELDNIDLDVCQYYIVHYLRGIGGEITDQSYIRKLLTMLMVFVSMK